MPKCSGIPPPEVLGGLLEERLIGPAPPLMTVPRLLHQTVTVLWVIPEDELVVLETLADEPDEPIVEDMDRTVHPERGVAVRVEVRAHLRMLGREPRMLIGCRDDVAPTRSDRPIGDQHRVVDPVRHGWDEINTTVDRANRGEPHGHPCSAPMLRRPIEW